MIKLFGNPLSTCTRKVLFALHETNTPYELAVLDFAKGDHKSPAHLARQPFGKMPALEDDGFKLFESRAMARYIDEKAGFQLTPKDIRGRALMEQWISVESAQFYGNAMTHIYHTVFQRPQKPEDLEKASAGLDQCCGVLEVALGHGKPWLVGEQFTIAEVAFAPYLEYGMVTAAKAVFAKYPKFTAWWSRISERPAWQKTRG